jgi:hypothetical protein
MIKLKTPSISLIRERKQHFMLSKAHKLIQLSGSLRET